MDENNLYNSKADSEENPPKNYNSNSNTENFGSFYFEPTGFDGFDMASARAMKSAEKRSEKMLRKKHERSIIIMLSLIFVCALALSVYGIVSDVRKGKSSVAGVPVSKNVVLYKNEKPENSLKNIKADENGRYTTEGVAEAVRPSIVEIYTYSDSKRRNLMGTGSGVIISDDGYIVTNAHVLQADGFHSVSTTDDRIFEAEIVGRDSKTDIAVIKIDGSNLVPAVLGDSDETVVGEQVMAIGNPAGLSSTVTDGIVSAVNRKIRSDSTGFEMDCIQTNADISPGNSGGALVNMYGQVIGITSSKYVNSSYEGLGFAITINEALPIIEELIDNGFMSGRFRIGIMMIDMSISSNVYAVEEELGFEIPDGFEGLYITDISEDCDIYNTDLKAGDFIVEIDGQKVSSYDELYDAVSSKFKAGDKVPAKCAHLEKGGKIEYYDIEFELMEDTSGDY